MKVISTFFLLFAITSSLAAITPVFADHPVEVKVASSDTRGCEDTNTCFIPYEITVHPGSTVTWISDDGARHTITSGGIVEMGSSEVGEKYPGGNGFHSGLLEIDQPFEHTFDVLETHEYFCMIHPWMLGIVIVEAEVVEETTEEVPEEVVEETTEEVPEEVVEETTEVVEETTEEGGGCLIATATFGSELAPQIQQLRELRDNSLLQTNSGTTFMSGFNTIYYSFSPTIADWERQNPIFKEAVKVTITPLLTSLSILNYVDIDSESEMLGYGISIILLNIGMYFVAPAVVILKISQRIRK